MSRVHEWRNSIVTPGDKRPRSSPAKGQKAPSNSKSVEVVASQGAAALTRPKSAIVQSSDKLRPLGRSLDRRIPNNHNTGRGFITVIKSEILQLQRKLDSLQYGTNVDDKVTEVSSEMHDLDQELFGLQYDPDPTTLYKVHAALLEILVDRLRKIASNISSKATCSNIGSLTRGSQRPWSAGTQTTHSTWAQPQGSGTRAVQHTQQLSSRVDAVIHVSELLHSIIEVNNSNNDSISNYMPSEAKASPTTVLGRSDPEAPLLSQTKNSEVQTEQTPTNLQCNAEMEAILIEKQELEKRLQGTINSLQDAGRYSAVTYANIDPVFLKKHGISVPKKPSLTPQQAAAIVNGIRELVDPSDGVPETTEDSPPGKAKGATLKQQVKQPQETEGDEAREREIAVLAHMHVALSNQNKALVSLVKLVEDSQEQTERTKEEHERKVVILQNTVTDLERKISGWGSLEIKKDATQRREILEREQKIEELNRIIAASQPPVKVRRPVTIATVKDPPEETEIQKNLKRQINALELEAVRQRKLVDSLQQENEDLKKRLNSELATSASLQRDLTASSEANKLGDEIISELKADMLRSEAELEKLRETSQEIKSSKAADTDTIRKLNIEISINRNTISKLNEREDQILSEVKEANWKYERVKQTLEEEQKQFVTSRVTMEHEMDRLRQAAEVQKKLSSDLRKDASAREDELQNLRETERRLQNLQRDFKNYTETKIRQGEETEEEEKCMQECLLLLQTELFKLPETSAREDAELMIAQLEDKRRKLEAEKRKQEKVPATRSAKGQIVEILKRRLNAIQLYAFKEKNKTFALEDEVRTLRHTVSRCKAEQQHDMMVSKDLAARYQLAQEKATDTKKLNDSLHATVGELRESIHSKTEVVEALQRDIRAQQEELTTAGTKLMDKTAHLRRFGVESENENDNL